MKDVEVIEILAQAIAVIEQYPEHWKQDTWHCGTNHCLAGWCDIVTHPQFESDRITDIVFSENISPFAIAHPQLQYLFLSKNNLSYLRQEVKHLQATKVITGYDRSGYDSNGFDENGYNRKGFDSDGYDEYGYDSDGYDRNGQDADGHTFKSEG